MLTFSPVLPMLKLSCLSLSYLICEVLSEVGSTSSFPEILRKIM